jgi:WD40 repeat protein
MRIIQSDNPRPLNLLAVGPNGLVAAASSTFGAGAEAELWEVASGERRFAHRGAATQASAIAFTPDGLYLLRGSSSTISALNTNTGDVTPVGEFGSGFQFALSQNGTRLVTTGAAGHYSHVACFLVQSDVTLVRLWTDGEHSMQDFDSPVISPNGARVAIAQRAISFARATLAVRDTETGKVLATIPTDPASPVQQLAFTADGSKLLVRTESRTVQLFEAATGASAGELVHPGRPYVTGMAVHPRGPVACARTNGTVTFWDAEKREQLRTLDWKAGRLVSVAFSPDGSLAAAGTEDGKIVVWDVDV